jgi:hypothetical protein
MNVTFSTSHASTDYELPVYRWVHGVPPSTRVYPHRVSFGLLVEYRVH